MRPITKGAGKRYDDLRKVREAKFGRQNETKLETKTETKNPQEGPTAPRLQTYDGGRARP
jgi:hypothetical protein